ncbi:hypothetical protein Jolie1_019 [Mycobacterium phage Julie1]|uniref:Uncharacterized protein n=1 Tax=Mycobacterium phage Julie1 TaxID=1463812 RepID=W8EIN1_9CAUD|nr:hypothetical protein CG90_gp19 [Mycobacterium phage Julie1]AHJ88519.1 hypothetical protein Jolie1_019 [Mycobacterium phage Julie1]
MTEPVCRTDPAMEIIAAVSDAMAVEFGPREQCGPLVGATENVRFLAGDGAPLAAWDSHAKGGKSGCKEPFVWVRAMRRYRSATFPREALDQNPCSLPRVMPVEVGVAWCAVISDRPDRAPKFEDLAREAEVSMDVAWRLENALCRAAKTLVSDDHKVGTDTLVPYGPEGGIIAWSGVIYASY